MAYQGRHTRKRRKELPNPEELESIPYDKPVKPRKKNPRGDLETLARELDTDKPPFPPPSSTAVPGPSNVEPDAHQEVKHKPLDLPVPSETAVFTPLKQLFRGGLTSEIKLTILINLVKLVRHRASERNWEGTLDLDSVAVDQDGHVRLNTTSAFHLMLPRNRKLSPPLADIDRIAKIGLQLWAEKIISELDRLAPEAPLPGTLADVMMEFLERVASMADSEHANDVELLDLLDLHLRSVLTALHQKL